MTLLRLDKFLADAGIGTRSDVKNKIKKGSISVNGIPVNRPEFKVNTDSDKIICNGSPVSYSLYEYYLLHKPAGYVTAVKDNLYPTVMELVTDASVKNLAPVGRLDKDTEGLLLITNDGELAHNLLSPKKHVDKTYYAKIDSPVDASDIEAFSRGIDIGDDSPTLPAKLEIINSGKESEILLTIHEGRFHQVKRMFHACGKEVTYLKRISMGSLSLGSLAKGSFRKLTDEEIAKLKQH